MGANIVSLHIIPIYDFSTLPFKYNANWSIHQPEFELQVETTEGQVSWFVCRDILNDGKLYVILPCFVDAPWKAPVLETRGSAETGLVEFNKEAFAKKLASQLSLEFCTWSVFLHGLVKIRAFALNVDPNEGVIQPCLLTDNENFDEAEYGNWCLADWRLYDFAQWSHNDELCRLIGDYVQDQPQEWVHPKFDYWAQAKEDFDVLLACAMSLQEPEFLKFLDRFDLSDDFEFGVFHAHDENRECNFVRNENQDLSVLMKQSD